jgi:hypothetical protein
MPWSPCALVAVKALPPSLNGPERFDGQPLFVLKKSLNHV